MELRLVFADFLWKEDCTQHRNSCYMLPALIHKTYYKGEVKRENLICDVEFVHFPGYISKGHFYHYTLDWKV